MLLLYTYIYLHTYRYTLTIQTYLILPIYNILIQTIDSGKSLYSYLSNIGTLVTTILLSFIDVPRRSSRILILMNIINV